MDVNSSATAGTVETVAAAPGGRVRIDHLVTSGTFSPTLRRGVGLALLSREMSIGMGCGETGSSNGDPGTLGGTAKSNHVVYQFWFRSASTQPDPGSYVSTTISDIPGNRLTYFGIFDERPNDANSNCPDISAGCFHIDVSEVISGNDRDNDGDGTFVDYYSDPLQRGVWYRGANEVAAIEEESNHVPAGPAAPL